MLSHSSLLATAVILMAMHTAALSGELLGLVVGVADGDTITVLDVQHQQHKIRLAGIDAPEKHQDFGNRSKQSHSGESARANRGTMPCAYCRCFTSATAQVN